jgi:hypothetical protein
MDLDILLHAQFVRVGIVIRAGGFAAAVLEGESGRAVGLSAVGFGVESDAGGMNDNRGALRRT